LSKLGRPPGENALSRAAIQRAYRLRQKDKGVAVRSVHPEAEQISRLSADEREKYRNALLRADYLANEVARLHAENDKLWVELRHETTRHNITLKELISLRATAPNPTRAARQT